MIILTLAAIVNAQWVDTISIGPSIAKSDGHKNRTLPIIAYDSIAYAAVPRVGDITMYDVFMSKDSMKTWVRVDSNTNSFSYDAIGIGLHWDISKDRTIWMVGNVSDEFRPKSFAEGATTATRPSGIDAWAANYGIGHSAGGSYIHHNVCCDTGNLVCFLFPACNGTPYIDTIKMKKTSSNLNVWDSIQIVAGRATAIWNFSFRFNKLNWLTGIYHNYIGSGGADGDTVFFHISKDTGKTYIAIKIDSTHYFFNPAFEWISNSVVIAWAQTTTAPRGVYQNISSDSGMTWGAWTLIFASCGYGDPSPRYKEGDGLYLAFRTDSLGTCNGGGTGTCSEDSRWWIYKSTDNGTSWKKEDSICTDNMFHEQSNLNGGLHQRSAPIVLFGCQYDNAGYDASTNEQWKMMAVKYSEGTPEPVAPGGSAKLYYYYMTPYGQPPFRRGLYR